MILRELRIQSNASISLTCWGNRHKAPNWGTAGLLGRSWICHFFPNGLRRFSWHRGINLFVNNTDDIKSKLIIDNYQRKDRLIIYDHLREKRLYHNSTRKQRFWISNLRKKTSKIRHRKITKTRVQVHNLIFRIYKILNACHDLHMLTSRTLNCCFYYLKNDYHNLAFSQRSKSVRRKRTLTSVPLLKDILQK